MVRPLKKLTFLCIFPYKLGMVNCAKDECVMVEYIGKPCTYKYVSVPHLWSSTQFFYPLHILPLIVREGTMSRYDDSGKKKLLYIPASSST